MKTKRARVSVEPLKAQTAARSRARTRGDGYAGAKMPTEAEEQATFFQRVAWMGPEWARGLTYATLNGVALHPRVAAKQRALGLVAGIPDIIVDIPCGSYHGLRIELKRRDGGAGLSDAQGAYFAAAGRAGYRVIQANGADVAWLRWVEWVDDAGRELGLLRPLPGVIDGALALVPLSRLGGAEHGR